jgi:hypothetical protein
MKSTTLAKEKKKLQAIINKWVRIYHSDENGMVRCYTCKEDSEKKHWKEIDAGHFVGGAKNYCRYDERNIRPQCFSCNRMKSGNLGIFGHKLAKELGDNVVEELLTYRDVQYQTFQIQALIQIWKGKLNQLARDRGIEL